MNDKAENRKMFVVAYCKDKVGEEATQERHTHMQGHMDHVASIVDHIALAGPSKCYICLLYTSPSPRD